MSSAASVVPSSQPPLSQVERVVDTFVAPSKTFRDINRSASWWMPLLLIILVSYGFIYVVEKKVGFEKVTENTMRLSPKQMDQIDSLPADQREQRMATITKFTRIGTYSYPVIAIVFLLLMGLILWGSYSFGAGAQVSFGKSMAVVVYGNLVTLVRAVLAVIALLAGASTDTFTFQNPVATSPAYFIDGATHPVLFALGSQFDVTVLWALVLVSIGFTYVTKVKKGTSYAIVFGWWLVLVIVSVSIAAARS